MKMMNTSSRISMEVSRSLCKLFSSVESAKWRTVNVKQYRCRLPHPAQAGPAWDIRNRWFWATICLHLLKSITNLFNICKAEIKSFFFFFPLKGTHAQSTICSWQCHVYFGDDWLATHLLIIKISLSAARSWTTFQAHSTGFLVQLSLSAAAASQLARNHPGVPPLP